MTVASWVVPQLTQTNPRWRRPQSLILKKISITPDWIKSQNRKLIRVTSSYEGLKHNYVRRYLNEIWYTTQIPHYLHAGMAQYT